MRRFDVTMRSPNGGVNKVTVNAPTRDHAVGAAVLREAQQTGELALQLGLPENSGVRGMIVCMSDGSVTIDVQEVW